MSFRPASFQTFMPNCQKACTVYTFNVYIQSVLSRWNVFRVANATGVKSEESQSGRLFSPAALLWCTVSVNIKAQSPATPGHLIRRSLSTEVRYGSESLQTVPEWGGLQSLLVPTNTAVWDTHRETVTHKPAGTAGPPSVSSLRECIKYVVKVFPLSHTCSLFLLSPVVAMVLFQFGIAGEWLTWRPGGEGQALAAIKLTCLRYQVLCFLTM